VDDKMRIQTLREQGLGYRAIAAKYSENWKLDGAPAHTAKLAQNWIATNCSDFIGKDEWPLNSPDLNFLEHVWGAMHERYKTFQPKPNTIDELKKVWQTIWDDLPQNSINKAILSFVKTSSSCESWERTL